MLRLDANETGVRRLLVAASDKARKSPDEDISMALPEWRIQYKMKLLRTCQTVFGRAKAHRSGV